MPDLDQPRRRLGRVPKSRISGVVVVALLGLVLAAAITYAASTLVSQPIGLTSEPATLGEGLAPSDTGTRTTPTRTVTVTTTTPTSSTPTSTTTTSTAPTDDHGGGGSDGDGDDD